MIVFNSSLENYLNVTDKRLPSIDYVDLTSYTTEFYDIPSMGYLEIQSNTTETSVAQVLNDSLLGIAISAPINGYNSIIVFKGAKVRHMGGKRLRFYPISKVE